MKNNSRTLVALFVTALALLVQPASAQAQICTGTGNGALKVTSFPSGATVSVDGVDTGKRDDNCCAFRHGPAAWH